MATNVFHGRDATVSCGATSSAVTKIGSVRKFDVERKQTTIDATSFDSAGDFQGLDNIREWTITSEALTLSTSGTNYAAQALIRSKFATGTRLFFQFLNSTAATGPQKFVGYAYVESWKQSGDLKDVQLQNFAIKGDGALTES